MKITGNLLALAGLAGSIAAAPAQLMPRQLFNANGSMASPPGDVNILNFALILEYLEINLYETVVSTYSRQDFINAGYDGAVRDTLNQIITQELTHIAALQMNVKMLGGQVIQPCKYSYGSASTLGALLNVTDIVNALGPAAYSGAGAFITSKVILTEGSAIGNVESRHNSWINGALGRSEVPNAFQTSLTPTQSYGVGQQFIISGSCPAGNSALMGAITAYLPSLNVTNAGAPAAPLNPGGTIMLAAPGISAPRAAFLYGSNTTIVSVTNSGSGMSTATIPLDAFGAIFVVLTNATAGQAVDNSNSLTAPQAFFVDNPSQNYAGLNFSTYTFSA